jgi:dihydrofolate reductase
MRKLIVSMNITLDGFIAGATGELDWHYRYWNDAMTKCLATQLAAADTLLLGRKTYLAMADYWPQRVADLSCFDEDIAFAELINHREKIVFSGTLQDISWNNSRVVKRELQDEVQELKRQEGSDLLVYGSATLVSELSRLSLIDEYVLWLHPVMIGKGRLFFKRRSELTSFRLYDSRVFTTGVVMLRYAVEKD